MTPSLPDPGSLLQEATGAMRQGDPDRAGRLAASALEQFRARGDADGRMRSENLLGAVAFERGEIGRRNPASEPRLALRTNSRTV